MREIKFRAWDLKTKKMHTAENINFCGRKTVTVQYNPVKKICLDSAILMQYTGVKDKNGAEIYEGDILLDDFAEEYYIVKFFDGAFIAECDGVIYDLADVALITTVVGNIYENPELVSNEADT